MIDFYIEPQLGGMVITLTNAEEKDYFKKENVELHGKILKVGDLTNLDGIFTENVRYAGIFYKNSNLKVMCFCIGERRDLFERVAYYNCFYYLSPTRIVAKYSTKTARDYNWINNCWK